MATLRVTKEFDFEGAHALMGYDGKCKNIHGHSYRLFVTVKGRVLTSQESPKSGMVLDFSLLKKIVNQHVIEKFDHALLMREDAPLLEELKSHYCSTMSLPFQPTCENLIIYIAQLIKEHLPKELELFSLKLYETATSYVEWFADENL